MRSAGGFGCSCTKTPTQTARRLSRHSLRIAMYAIETAAHPSKSSSVTYSPERRCKHKYYITATPNFPKSASCIVRKSMSIEQTLSYILCSRPRATSCIYQTSAGRSFHPFFNQELCHVYGTMEHASDDALLCRRKSNSHNSTSQPLYLRTRAQCPPSFDRPSPGTRFLPQIDQMEYIELCTTTLC